MDDDLLLPPPEAPIGELIRVKGHPSKPCKDGKIATAAWDKVLNDELFQVGNDEASDARAQASGEARLLFIRRD